MQAIEQKRSRIVSAPIEVVWERIIRIEDWPVWHAAFSKMSIPPEARSGTQFTYTYNGTVIRAAITDIVPMSRFGFRGLAWGVKAQNLWHLAAASPNSTAVIVHEEMRGILPLLLRGPFNRRLGDGLDSWLTSLELSLKMR